MAYQSEETTIQNSDSNRETNPTKKNRNSKKTIPPYLIYEEMDGKPIYYRGYEKVLKRKKQFEEIMGSSSLQSFIISCIYDYLVNTCDKKAYKVLSNELGLHISHGNNLAADIAIFERERIKDYLFKDKYIDIPPKIVIEVDPKADLNKFDETMDYINTKSQKLFEFGVENVFWILSTHQQIITAVPNGKWLLSKWYNEIQLTDDLKFSLEQLLKEEGIKY
jgi:Uma2 family endonuclease